MTSLLDLGPLTKEVLVNGKVLVVRGLNATDIFYLLRKYPEFTDVIMSGTEVTEDRLVAVAAQSMDGLAEIIACAADMRNNPEAVAVARNLAASDALLVVEEVSKMTFRDGPIPFVSRLMGMMRALLPSVVEVVTPSQDSWSASLVGDPRPTRGNLHLVS